MAKKSNPLTRRSPAAKVLSDRAYRPRVVADATKGHGRGKAVDYCPLCGDELQVGAMCDCTEDC